jgi:hypothetical protein
MASFTPRPIYHVKQYSYVVEEGDSASRICKKLGVEPSRYHELVGANLFGRVLQPLALGSPYSARTFAALEVGEQLRIPAHWPDNPNVLAAGVDAAPATVFDPIYLGMAQQMGAIVAGTGGQSPTPKELEPSVINAAIQWWLNGHGTTPAEKPADYAPYLLNAIAWTNTIGKTLTPEQANAFPWGPFLAMLPAGTDPTIATWATGTIPQTGGTRWSSLPWGYLAGLGPMLETIKVPPVQWPGGTASEFDVLAALQAAIKAATPDSHQCGGHATKGPDGKCYCDDGYTWITDDPTDPNFRTCKPDTSGPVAPSPTTCPSDTTFDPAGPAGPGCYVCDQPGTHYDLAKHMCVDVSGKVPGSGSTPTPQPPTPQPPAPAPPAPPTNQVKAEDAKGMSTGAKIAIAIGITLAVVGAGAGIATVVMKSKDDKKEPQTP